MRKNEKESKPEVAQSSADNNEQRPKDVMRILARGVLEVAVSNNQRTSSHVSKECPTPDDGQGGLAGALSAAEERMSRFIIAGNKLANSVDAGNDEARNVLLDAWNKACQG